MAKMTLDVLVSQLRAAFQGDLVSIVLYGSATSDDHDPKRSDQNVLLIVKRLGLDQLRGAAATARAWADAGNPPPLTFTVSEWRGSADIFAMEYADILDRHRVLHGTAPFDGITVDPANLRLQLEREAMGKLLMLRQGVLASGGDEGRLSALLGNSSSTILVIFRAVMRLHGSHPPRDDRQLVDQVAKVAGFDAAAFHRAVAHGRAREKISKAEASSMAAAYVAGMERLVAYLDHYGSAASA